MIHQPLGGVQGQTTDMKIHVERMLKIKENLNKILSENTGQPMILLSKTQKEIILWMLKKH